jgi:hypothetical protein
MNPKRLISEVLPSYYFHPVAEVLVTECGHRHVRPTGMHQQGGMLHCPFCEDDQVGCVSETAGEASATLPSEAQKTRS